jgi:L-aminopeptidase/D-esterase-like protein
VTVGHSESDDGATGVSAVLFDRAAPAIVDVRGGASATYDTSSLSLDSTYGSRWAIFFAGGSLFGLDAARGIRTHVLELGRGMQPFGNPNRVAPISGAALFDLPAHSQAIPDYLPLGYEAARLAVPDRSRVGRVGAGAGATVGKYLGRDRAMPGGLGFAAGPVGRRGHLAIMMAINAVGAVRDPTTGEWLAGARGRGGRIVPPRSRNLGAVRARGTTLGLLVTDLAIGRPALARAAAIVHAAIGSAIVPYLTASDGDVLFAVSTERVAPGRVESRPGEFADLVGGHAAELAVRAARSAVRPDE